MLAEIFKLTLRYIWDASQNASVACEKKNEIGRACRQMKLICPFESGDVDYEDWMRQKLGVTKIKLVGIKQT